MSSGKPWLSILLPVYKVEQYLNACAQSILAQADDGVELIFVDDASPDGCAALLQALQQAHPNQVRVIRHALNQGVSVARNSLLDAASGDYLWFIDPDDVLEPGAIAALKALIESQAPDLLMCDFRAFEDGSDGQARRARLAHVATFQGPSDSLQRDRDLLIQGLFKAGQLHPWSKIVRRSCWPQDLRFPAGRIFEDLAVLPRLALQIDSYFHVPKVWVAYRQSAGSALANLSVARMHDWAMALQGYGAQLLASRPTPSAQTLFEVAHFSARTFIRACKRRKALREGDCAADLRSFGQLWRESSPLSAAQLCLAYLRRGRVLRALQFASWLRRAGRT